MDECDIEYPGFDDEANEPPLPEGLELRPMEPRDLYEVKRLHEQCFPVRYDTSFYENVVRGVIVRGKGQSIEPLYTQVAVAPWVPWESSVNVDVDALPAETPALVMDERDVDPAGSQHPKAGNCPGDRSGVPPEDDWRRGEGNVGSGCPRKKGRPDEGGDGASPVGRAQVSAVSAGDGDGNARDQDSEDDYGAHHGLPTVHRNSLVDAYMGVNSARERIVGLITCQVLPLERCMDRHRLGLRPPYGTREGHSEVVYILTLGTETSYRRRGIGRALLQRCVWLSRQEPTIGAVYLHVITTNPAAHRFYEAEGFIQVCCINDYYKIKGRLYDCFLYALYVNGAQPPGSEGWSLGGIARRLYDVFAFVGRTLGYLADDDDGDDDDDESGCDSWDEDEENMLDTDAEDSPDYSSPANSAEEPLYSATVSAAAGAGAACDACVRFGRAGYEIRHQEGAQTRLPGRTFNRPVFSAGINYCDSDSEGQRRCRPRINPSEIESVGRDGIGVAQEGADKPSTRGSSLSAVPYPPRGLNGTSMACGGREVLWSAAASQEAWMSHAKMPAAVRAMNRGRNTDDASVVEVQGLGSDVDLTAPHKRRIRDEAEQILQWERVPDVV